jgi:hypothetical protein
MCEVTFCDSRITQLRSLPPHPEGTSDEVARPEDEGMPQSPDACLTRCELSRGSIAEPADLIRKVLVWIPATNRAQVHDHHGVATVINELRFRDPRMRLRYACRQPWVHYDLNCCDGDGRRIRVWETRCVHILGGKATPIFLYQFSLLHRRRYRRTAALLI